MKPFNVTLKGLGFFPNNNFMRVAWIGSPSEKFIEFHNTVNNVLAHVFSKEKPIPHLTLARVRSQKYVKNIQKLGEKYKDQEFGSFEVKNMKLKKSVLARNGPVYEDLKVFDLHDN